MSFWGFVGILLILGVMTGALYISKLAINREIEEQNRRKKIQEIRNELIDVDELVHTLMVYDRNVDLLDALQRRILKDINEGLRLIPDNEALRNDYADLQRLSSQINVLREAPKAPETPSSDRQIFLLKRHFARAVKLIREMQSHGDIDELSGNNHRARLMRNALILEVDAYRKQGEEAKLKGEVSSAANFYKHAKELLVDSEHKFADKTERLQEVSREISGLYVTLTDQNESKPK